MYGFIFVHGRLAVVFIVVFINEIVASSIRRDTSIGLIADPTRDRQVLQIKARFIRVNKWDKRSISAKIEANVGKCRERERRWSLIIYRCEEFGSASVTLFVDAGFGRKVRTCFCRSLPPLCAKHVVAARGLLSTRRKIQDTMSIVLLRFSSSIDDTDAGRAFWWRTRFSWQYFTFSRRTISVQ